MNLKTVAEFLDKCYPDQKAKIAIDPANSQMGQTEISLGDLVRTADDYPSENLKTDNTTYFLNSIYHELNVGNKPVTVVWASPTNGTIWMDVPTGGPGSEDACFRILEFMVENRNKTLRIPMDNSQKP